MFLETPGSIGSKYYFQWAGNKYEKNPAYVLKRIEKMRNNNIWIKWMKKCISEIFCWIIQTILETLSEAGFVIIPDITHYLLKKKGRFKETNRHHIHIFGL